MIQLSDCCDIQIGFTARGRLEPVPNGVRAIQLRDTTPDGRLGPSAIGTYLLGSTGERYWARRGDVLFRSRGDQNTAVFLDESFGEPAVAVMPLILLRPDTARLLPEYLTWFLNQPEAQNYFDASARGTGIRMIPVGCLASVKIPVPPLSKQAAIAATEELAREEFRLSSRLAECRFQLRSLALLDRAHLADATTTNQGGRS